MSPLDPPLISRLPQKGKTSQRATFLIENRNDRLLKFGVHFLCNILGTGSVAGRVQGGARPHGKAGDGLGAEENLVAGAGVYRCVLR